MGKTISCFSRLHKSVFLSTTKTEYMALAEASKELILLTNFLLELGLNQEDYVLRCDN